MKHITRKQAFMRNGKKHFVPLYNRASEKVWNNDYTPEQMEWLWNHKMIEYTDKFPGESMFYKYIQFTKKGLKWNRWYSCTLREYCYYYVFNIPAFKRFYQKFMIKVFHKHYDWQDYVGVNLNDI